MKSKLLIFGVVFVALAGLLGCDKKTASTPTAKATYTFDDLKKATVGKTKEEVKVLFGAPDEVHQNRAVLGEEWVYQKVIYDAVSEKYSQASVVFDRDTKLCYRAGPTP